MELHLDGVRRWARREPDWAAAAVSGFAAGAVLMVLELLWAGATGANVWDASHRIAAILVGGGCGLVNGLLIAYGGVVPFIATLAMLASARGLAEIISIHHYSLSTATATRIADRIIADLKRGGIEASYKLTSKPSGVAGMLIPQALVPGSSFLLELRDSRAGRPRIRSSECGHMFAQILKGHAGVATDVIKERALALGEAGWEERFEIGVANVATHEIGHAFSRHSDSHSLMKHGGAERDEWLFDPTLPWR